MGDHKTRCDREEHDCLERKQDVVIDSFSEFTVPQGGHRNLFKVFLLSSLCFLFMFNFFEKLRRSGRLCIHRA